MNDRRATDCSSATTTTGSAATAGRRYNRFWVVAEIPSWYKTRNCFVNIWLYVPGSQMTSIFEGQPRENKAFSNQNKGHLGSKYRHFKFWFLGLFWNSSIVYKTARKKVSQKNSKSFYRVHPSVCCFGVRRATILLSRDKDGCTPNSVLPWYL